MISASRLTRRFGPRVVVDEVSFEVARSEIVALLGPNGAGKTTTMRMLAGLIAPTSGLVTIEGMRLTRASAAHLRSRIGFLTEAPGLWDRLSVRENLHVYGRLYGLPSPKSSIDRMLELFELRDSESTRAAELSKGMRQKVALARAMLHQPTVLLLDEPTSGLDPEIRRTVRALLEDRRAAGCAILVSTHNLDEAERIADRVAVLQGRLLALDRPDALRRRMPSGRVLIRVLDDPHRYLPLMQSMDASAALNDRTFAVRASDVERDTSAMVSALVTAGARVVEVRPEVPALEDVYLHLMEQSERGEPRNLKERESSAEGHRA